MIIISIILLLFLIHLIYEQIIVRSLVEQIPLRIAVTGTRGKSSVVRLIAAALAANGYRVVAKTTGSKAMVILPSGKEMSLHRIKKAHILEQKRLLCMAKKYKAQVLVAEVMSINPENYTVELHKLLKPHIVIVTNIRPDHIDALGELPHQASVIFARGIPRSCKLVLSACDEIPPRFNKILSIRGIPSRSISPDDYRELLAKYKRNDYAEWEINVCFALAVCQELGVSLLKALEGMYRAQPDFGALKAWRLSMGGKTWIVVNAFAANDPVSTMAVYRRVQAWGEGTSLPFIGLLNLRGDRLDRTLQWCQILSKEPNIFKRLFVVGASASAVVRKLRKAWGTDVRMLRAKKPAEIMQALSEVEPCGGIVFGFGNIGEMGSALVQYWEQCGDPICLSKPSSLD